MKDKTNAEKFDPFVFENKQAKDVNYNGHFGMKRMKPDATAVGVKNGDSPQMVYVYEHCG